MNPPVFRSPTRCATSYSAPSLNAPSFNAQTPLAQTAPRAQSRTALAVHSQLLRPLLRLLLLLVVLAGSACTTQGGPRGRALRVGVAPTYPPVIFEQDGEIVGIEADLARGIGARLGRRIVFERLGEDELLDGLERGEIDIVMSGLSITPEREGRVRFVAPYMQAGQLALIRSADLARFGRIQTIRRSGSRVGYVDGTTGERFVATELARATSFGFDDVESGLRSLRAGRIDYFVHAAPTVWRVAADPHQQDLHGLYQMLTEEQLAWAVRRDDAELKALLDTTLQQWQREGGIEAIIDRWIPVRVTIH